MCDSAGDYGRKGQAVVLEVGRVTRHVGVEGGGGKTEEAFCLV